MKHQNPHELERATAVLVAGHHAMSRRERLERWASLLEHHDETLNALRRLEFLPPDERRAYRAANTPLTVAFADPALREEGLRGDRLGDAMEFFGLNDGEAHRLLCDCHYYGGMTGPRVAKNLRRHAVRKERLSGFRNAIGRFFGRVA